LSRLVFQSAVNIFYQIGRWTLISLPGVNFESRYNTNQEYYSLPSPTVWRSGKVYVSASVRHIAACGTGSIFLSLNKAMEEITMVCKTDISAFNTMYGCIKQQH